MDVLCWEKRVINKDKLDERVIFDIYVFENPEIIPPRDGECYRIHPKNRKFFHWRLANHFLEKVENYTLAGIGRPEDRFCYLNNVNIEELSRKIGIEKKYLETILP